MDVGGEIEDPAMTGMYPIRKIWPLLAPVSFVFFLLSWTLAQTAGERLAPIASALQNKEFAKALELLHPALQEFPGNAQLWAMQGAAYVGEGHKKEALASFQSALKISPDYIPALEGAIQIDFEGGNPAAIPLIERLLRLRPADLTSHAMLAVLQYQQGKCAAAVTHFEKAEALLASQLGAQHAYGICLVKLKQFDRAATVFQRAVALDPSDSRERQLLAAIQLMAHKPQDALATLGPSLQSSPDAQTLELASTAYEDVQDTDQAVSTLRQAILLDPQNVNLYWDFAILSAAHQSFQVGIDVINDGIGQQPKAAPLYLARGVLYVQLGQYDKAQSDFEKAYELDPSQSLTSAALGLEAVQANDLNRALATVQEKLTRTPNDAPLLYLQADILSQKGAVPGNPEFQLAMSSAKKAVLLQPTLADARDVLAKLYLQTGQSQEAVEQCRKALEINPKDQAALYRLIQALQRTGDKTEVPELLKRFALLREQAKKDERQRYRYKLVEDEPQP